MLPFRFPATPADLLEHPDWTWVTDASFAKGGCWHFRPMARAAALRTPSPKAAAPSPKSGKGSPASGSEKGSLKGKSKGKSSPSGSVKGKGKGLERAKSSPASSGLGKKGRSKSAPCGSEKGSTKGAGKSSPPVTEKGAKGGDSPCGKGSRKGGKSSPPVTEKGSKGRDSSPGEKGSRKGGKSSSPVTEKGSKGKGKTVRSKGSSAGSKKGDQGQNDVVPGEGTNQDDKDNGAVGDPDAEEWRSFHEVWRHNIKDMSDDPPTDVTPQLFTDPLVVLPTEFLAGLKEFFDDEENTMLGVHRIRNIKNHPVMFEIFEAWRWEHYPDDKAFGDRPKKHLKQHCKFLQEMMAGAHINIIYADSMFPTRC